MKLSGLWCTAGVKQGGTERRLASPRPAQALAPACCPAEHIGPINLSLQQRSDATLPTRFYSSLRTGIPLRPKP